MRSPLASRVVLAALALAFALMAPAEAAGGNHGVPAAIEKRLGQPTLLGRFRGFEGRQAREAIGLLDEAFGVDATQVPVYLISKKELYQVDRILSGRTLAHERLVGLEHRGVVYVVDFGETLIHELLHALSRRFSLEAGRLGHHGLVEGMTQYMTIATGIRYLPTGMSRGSAYGLYVRFADRLAEVLGDDVIADCYFRGGFAKLERAADRALGKGRLARALGHLKQDDLGAALRALGAEAVSPFDGVFAD